MGDLISVIIPVYKVEDYLSRCINSILGQTYRNLEIILVDDGSPDQCGEMCDEFSRLDDRIIVVHKKNGGLSDARNAGIEIARGKYFTFLDSDDWVTKDYIEKLYQLLITTKADIAACNFIKTSRENVIIETSNVEIHEFSNIEALEQLTGRYYIQLVVTWGKIYNRNLFKEIRYPLGKVHEDEFVAHYLLFMANKIVFTTEQMLYYWQREDSIMGIGFSVRNKIHVAQALLDRAKFFDDIGLVESRDKTYKTIFFIYKQIIEYNDYGEENDYKQEVLMAFKSLRAKLREGNYKLKFRVFFEFYYKVPFTTRWIYKLHGKIYEVSDKKLR